MANDQFPSIVTEALRSVFKPIVEQSAKWPPVLAYGVPSILAALLIVVLRPSLPGNMFWLVIVLVLAPLLGYVLSDWDMRRQKAAARRARQAARQIITGNVFFEDGLPVKDVVLTVDGLDRKRETDENGWFQIEVNDQRRWVVRARYGDQIVTSTVESEDIQQPISLMFPKLQEPVEAENLPPLDPNLLALLEIEKERCRERKVGFFTPNLLSALLSSPGSPARRVFERAIPDKAGEIIERLRSYTPPQEQTFTDFDWFERGDVQSASRRAAQEGKDTIDSRLLLLGVLNTKSETQVELARLLGEEGFGRLVHAVELADQFSGTPGIGDLFKDRPTPPHD